jgi:hypothetical protein
MVARRHSELVRVPVAIVPDREKVVGGGFEIGRNADLGKPTGRPNLSQWNVRVFNPPWRAGNLPVSAVCASA